MIPKSSWEIKSDIRKLDDEFKNKQSLFNQEEALYRSQKQLILMNYLDKCYEYVIYPKGKDGVGYHMYMRIFEVTYRGFRVEILDFHNLDEPFKYQFIDYESEFKHNKDITWFSREDYDIRTKELIHNFVRSRLLDSIRPFHVGNPVANDFWTKLNKYAKELIGDK